MPMREFEDADGRTWTAWDTYPNNADPEKPSALARVLARSPYEVSNNGRLVRQSHADGWLTFICGHERRRLMPIPGQWETAELDLLRTYLRRSTDVPRPR